MKISQMLRSADAIDDLMKEAEEAARQQSHPQGLYEVWDSATKQHARDYIKALDKYAKLAPQDGKVYVETAKKIADSAAKLQEAFAQAAKRSRETAEAQNKLATLFGKALHHHKIDASL